MTRLHLIVHVYTLWTVVMLASVYVHLYTLTPSDHGMLKVSGLSVVTSKSKSWLKSQQFHLNNRRLHLNSTGIRFEMHHDSIWSVASCKSQCWATVNTKNSNFCCFVRIKMLTELFINALRTCICRHLISSRCLLWSHVIHNCAVIEWFVAGITVRNNGNFKFQSE